MVEEQPPIPNQGLEEPPAAPAAAASQPQQQPDGNQLTAMDQHQVLQPPEQLLVAQEDDILGYLPRYAIPSISSLLPAYTNSEQEFIHRTFHTGNYDYLKHLPDDIRFRQVVAARTARMEAARQFLQPSISNPLIKASTNVQGLFQAFPYQPSPYDLESQLESKKRTEGEAKRLAIGGKEFTLPGVITTPKYLDMTTGAVFPQLGGPAESLDELAKAYRHEQASKILAGTFTPAGTDKLTEAPTKAAAWEMMNSIKKLMEEDWEDIAIHVFENSQDCWVIRVEEASVDSTDGLRAYMNTLLRCNPLILDLRLDKVPEFWATTPGDGAVYYVVRPAWVRLPSLQSFFTMHPEERHWTTSYAVQEMSKTKPKGEDAAAKEASKTLGNRPVTILSRESRLVWGTNFMTNTPGTAAQAKMVQ